MRPTMALDHTGNFIRRHIGPDPHQIGDMLGTLGLATLAALIDQAVPASIRITEPLALAEAKSERETVSYLRRMRDRNRVFISMLGMGYYGTVVPAPSGTRRNISACAEAQPAEGLTQEVAPVLLESAVSPQWP